MTNNPRKIIGLEGYALKWWRGFLLRQNPDQENIEYLKAK